MFARTTWALVRHELRQFARDPSLLIFFIGLPLALAAFLEPAFGPLVAADGSGGSGADQAVPGMTVMFALFVIVYTGFGLFREHGWRTWDRLRLLHGNGLSILAGKAVVPFLLVLTQFAVMGIIGSVAFDVDHRGATLAGVVLVASFAAFLVTCGLLLATVCRTIEQMSAISGLLSITMAALGGAIVPVDSIASWARPLAPASPAYWAVEGLQVVVGGGSTGRILTCSAVLLACAAACVALTLLRFDATRTKTSWTY
jgi:ABC-2 type transport system permease protein